MSKNIKLKTTIPTTNKNISDEITDINKNIKEQLKNIINLQAEKITLNNEEKIKEKLSTAESLITDCHTLPQFNQLKNKDFNRLIYEWQKLSTKYANYKSEINMDKVIHKLYDFDQKVDNVESETGNLVYNILGFIASFSVVSASVSAINNMKSTIDIALFMCFTILILLITLIALNNFYKGHKGIKNKLQNNYFLLKTVFCIMCILSLCKGIKYIDENKEIVFQNIGIGIEKVRQEMENKEQN